MVNCLVEARDIQVVISGTIVLREVSLCVERGDYLVVLGPSGSGKTTLLRVLAGLVKPVQGRVLLGGRDVTEEPPWRRGVALVQQIPGLLPHLSVLDNIVLAAETRLGIPHREAVAEAERLLGLLRIGDVAGKRPGELSGGQLQRAAIAVALAIRPRVLLLDEPLSHLDRPLAEQLRLELRRLHRELGLTVIHVTHDQDEAISLASKLAILWQGTVIEKGAKDEVYFRPKSLVAARFLGHNIVDAKLFGKPGLLAVFPPEAVTVRETGEGLEAKVLDVVRERGRVILYTRLRGTREQVRAYVHPRELQRIPGRVYLHVEPASIHFLPAGITQAVDTNTEA